MKTKYLVISIFAALIAFTACESKSSNGKKASSGAEKIAEGFKELGGAAVEQAKVGVEKTREEGKAAMKRVEEKMADRDALKEEAQKAASAAAGALERAGQKVRDAAGQAKEAIEENNK